LPAREAEHRSKNLLATNAAKYGALSAPTGQIDLKWLHEADGRLTLRWREIGGPTVLMPTRQGLGTRIIERVIGQLKGKARLDWRTEGLVCEITLHA
jgi:two-component sensor histidine kinase